MSIERSHDFRFIYANGFGLKLSDNDIGLLLTNEQFVGTESIISYEGYVIMTPRALKILATILGDAVINLENKIGEITIPPETLAAIKTVPVGPSAS